MTDARLRGEWLTAAAHDGLTDAAYRVLHNALMHCAEQGTDGAIAIRELRFLYPGVLEPAILDELEHAGFWERTADGFQLVGWATTLGQSTAEEVATYRRNARERQQRRRERVKQGLDASNASQPPSSEVITRDDQRDVTTNVTGDVGKDRTGPDRPVLAIKKTRAHDCEFDPVSGYCGCGRRNDGLVPEGTPANLGRTA
ncbi:hypothetical protein IF188_13990 [Microbacterium sp. NEAU-LLC]|uniref:Uncharacterized protein n=1 Tax=Microbacterium helvum TaxID=2773713 RepID=A0ABR8NQ81_9MICO|nr:hypothetical protein [Microbacterium helvum]MBD3942807.1 hypothetical protein [Microbacterium helvum]